MKIMNTTSAAIAYMREAFGYVVMTGDFPGYAATGVEEDNPLVVLALALHTLLFG